MTSYFERMSQIAETANYIPNERYTEHSVKRGLRNEDGSGVLVGLTTIANVIGYSKDEAGVVHPIEGQLRYRGMEIRQIVEDVEKIGRFGFEETAYLLLFGDEPNESQRQEFIETMAGMRVLPDNFARDVLQTFRTGNIMNALARSVLTLYSIDDKADDLDLPNQLRQAMELIARLPVLVPYAHHVIQHSIHRKSLIVHRPDPTLSTAENFLMLLRPNKEFTETEASLLDLALLLHADHGGGNNSTFVTRAVSSTMTDFYSAIGAAIGSLKGPLHGGANLQVVRMMEDMKNTVKNPHSRDEVRDYLFKLLNKQAYDGAGKIYGMGHAVYTYSDPRAIILRERARKLAQENDREGELAMYELVEQEAPKVFQEFRKNPKAIISANVDFYSGFVYESMNIPRDLFTPLFAMGRMVGWAAHRIEMLSNPVKIMRPAYASVCQYCRNVRVCDDECRFIEAGGLPKYERTDRLKGQ